jgi:hypothetical protein
MQSKEIEIRKDADQRGREELFDKSTTGTYLCAFC